MEREREPTTERSLRLSQYTYGELEREARRVGSTPETLGSNYVQAFADSLGGEPAPGLPVELPDSARRPESADAVAVAIELTTSGWQALGAESERQEVPLPRVAEHAIYLRLATLDGAGPHGRAAHAAGQHRAPGRRRSTQRD